MRDKKIKRYLPLSGVRVLDFCWVGAGSYTTKILADLGADVIKIESTKSLDPLRKGPPYKDGIEGVNRSGYFADRNSSKKSMVINLKHKDSKKIIYDLLQESDVVTNNFTPGTMDRLGLGYQNLKEIKPDLIFIGMSMNGKFGPEKDMLGFGITMAALTGFMAACGLPDREAVGTNTNYPDHIPNPCHAAFAILSALRHRRRTECGQEIDLAQTEPMLSLMAPALMDFSANGNIYQRMGNKLEGCAPRGVYPAKGNDRWVAISIRSDNEWKALLKVLGDDNLNRPEWAHGHGREEDQSRIDEVISQATLGWEPYGLMVKLQGNNVACGVVQTAEDLIENDPQIKHRKHWKYLHHPEMGLSIYNGLPFTCKDKEVGPRFSAPQIGQHTAEIAREKLGLKDSDVERLKVEGLFI